MRTEFVLMNWSRREGLKICPEAVGWFDLNIFVGESEKKWSGGQ